MKKLILLTIYTLMSLSMFGFTVDGINYTASGSNAKVTGASNKQTSKVVIPATVKYGSKTYTVNEFSRTAFQNYPNLTELVIEDSETPITTSEKENGYSGVRAYPFKGSPLQKIYIGRPLYKVVSATSVEASVSTLSSTSDNIELEIGGFANDIRYIAFEELSGITRLTLGANVTNIGGKAFSAAANLKVLEYKGGLEPELAITYGVNSFAPDLVLDSLIIGRNPECNNQYITRNLLITSELKIIKDTPYYSPDVPMNVLFEYSEDALQNAGSGSGIFINAQIENMTANRLIDSFGDLVNRYASIRHLVFGDCWTDIPENVMAEHRELQSVSFPQTLQTIGNWAFNNCTGLTAIELPSSLRVIGNNAFSNAPLASINLPDGLETIGDGAFVNSKIESFDIPGSVTYIGNDALHSLAGISSVLFQPSDQPLELTRAIFNTVSIDNLTINRHIDTFRNIVDSYSRISHLVLGDCWTEIPEGMMAEHRELQSVSFPQTLQTIGNSAFKNCYGLTAIELPSSLRVIGNDAFSSAPLASVIFPEGLETIGDGAFFNSKIESFDIPGSVTYIGNDALHSLADISSVLFQPSDQPLELTNWIFNTVSIDNLTINRHIDTFRNIVDSYSRISHLVLGDCWTEIPEAMMAEHRELQSVSFPQTLQTIGNWAFKNCTGLTTIDCQAVIPPTVVNDFFSDDTFRNATLNIPGGTRQDYAQANGWKNFYNITETFPAPTYTVDINYDSPYGHIEVTGLNEDGRAIHGQPLTVKCVPQDANYVVKYLNINDENVTDALVDDTYQIDAVKGDITIEADFEQKKSDIIAINDTDAIDIRIIGHDLLIAPQQTDCDICLYDIAGHILYHGTLFRGIPKTLTDLPAGFYILSVNSTRYKLTIR